MKSRWAVWSIGVLSLVVLGLWSYSQLAPKARAVIEVEPASFDWGAIPNDRTVEHSFAVRNRGSSALEIQSVSTSCGCTTARIDKDVLAPGDAASLIVTFDPTAHGKLVGTVVRVVYIKSNDPEQPEVEIELTADLQEGPARW